MTSTATRPKRKTSARVPARRTSAPNASPRRARKPEATKTALASAAPKIKRGFILNTTWPKGEPLPTVKVDMSRRKAFLLLPEKERERRLQAFIDYFAPAFADYSSNDFRADQRREAERD